MKVIIIPQPFVLPETDFGATSHPPLEVINKTLVVLLLEDSFSVLPPLRREFTLSTRDQLLPPTIFGE